MKKILVNAVPNSRANDIKEVSKNVYKVKIAAPPIDGKANKILVKMLAKHFKVHKKDIVFVSGVGSKKKVIGILNE